MEGPLEISFIAEGCPSLNILSEMKMKFSGHALLHNMLTSSIVIPVVVVVVAFT